MFLVRVAVIKRHNDATVLRNTLLSSVTKEFHDNDIVVGAITPAEKITVHYKQEIYGPSHRSHE